MLERLLETLSDLEYPKAHHEILVVDDGSTDDTANVAESMGARVIRQPENLGRVSTRERGAREARFETLVFIDARLQVQKDLLKRADALKHQPLMGVGTSDKTRSTIDRVFYCIRRRVYRPFEPQHRFGPELWLTPFAFDGRPKGTGLLIIDRELFLSCALEDKGQDVNDDTRLLRRIVEKAPILRHTDLPFFYEHRQDWAELLRHTFFRGPKFLDYYLTPGGPLHRPYLMGLCGLAAFASLSLFYPLLWLWLALILIFALLVGSLILAEDAKDFFTCLIFFPPVGLAFCGGIAFSQLSRWTGRRDWVRH